MPSVGERFQGLSDRLKTLESKIDALTLSYAALAAKVQSLSVGRPPKKPVQEYLSSKTMLAMAGAAKDEAASGFLKFHAEQFSKRNGLEVRYSGIGQEGTNRHYVYFHHTAVEYAVTQYKAEKDAE